MSDNTHPGGQSPAFGRPVTESAPAPAAPRFASPEPAVATDAPVSSYARAAAEPVDTSDEASFGAKAADRAKDLLGSAKSAMSSAASSVSSATSPAVSSVAATVSGDADRAKDAVPGARLSLPARLPRTAPARLGCVCRASIPGR